ncbi:hypothetical protein SCP_0105370 [Sparassis crispa]|uniref:Uncharacterized protein n=1 Tax=Sparassis crispa TaxID=139825 RepID=A0A401G665_9APHY|nr:hypothetical protein SCP_0105370 [Sparassis crispa]GBE77656.1 hypothetical protein SCP_0105370 [Sparassis crispa]
MQITYMDADLNTYGFPSGYFLIRSVPTNRVFDVTEGFVADSTEVILWPETETSMVEGIRDPGSNNQVFFVDGTGHLCSRSSGHALDIQHDRVVIRHRRPIVHPYPNAFSHPLPRFSYDSETKHISVQFAVDPSYHASPDEAATASAWKDRTFLLTSIPLRQPHSLIDDASAFFSSALASPLSFFGALQTGPSAKAEEIFSSGDIDLREDEILEQDRTEEGEVDDSLDKYRKVRVVAVSKEDVKAVGQQARSRMQWEVIPLRTGRNRTTS